MNKKLSIVMVLILYAALAGIPSVMKYLQENKIIVESYGGSCGSCHVEPGASTPGNLTDPKELIKNAQPEIDQMGMHQIFYPGFFRQMSIISSIFISGMTSKPGIKSISNNKDVVVQDPDTTTGTLECVFCHKDIQNPHVNGGNLCFNCHIT